MSAPRPPETLVTARTLLRQVRPEDTDAIFEYASSPIATRYMVWSRATSRGASDQVERSTRSWADGSGFPWAATLRSSGELIGMIELRINLPKADFGYIFRERFWGQGLATEVVRCVVDWACAQPEIIPGVGDLPSGQPCVHSRAGKGLPPAGRAAGELGSAASAWPAGRPEPGVREDQAARYEGPFANQGLKPAVTKRVSPRSRRDASQRSWRLPE